MYALIPFCANKALRLRSLSVVLVAVLGKGPWNEEKLTKNFIYLTALKIKKRLIKVVTSGHPSLKVFRGHR